MRGIRVRIVAVAAVLVGVAGGALMVAPAHAATALATGDVLLSIGGGKVEDHQPSGTLVQTLDSTSGTNENDGMCFDSNGNLFSTNGFTAGTVAKFDKNGNLVNATFVTVAETANGHPESCVTDAAGDVYIGLPDASPAGQIQKYDKNGTLLDTFTGLTVQDRGTDWLDLAKDQCTIFYTSEGTSVFRYDTCTKTQLTPFATGLPGPCYAHRLLADGSVLVGCSANVVHLSSSGTVLTTFTAASLGFSSGFIFAINLDPDGTTFWTADYDTGQVVRAKISDGTVVGGFNHTAGNGPFGGLAVVGEITAANPTTTTSTTIAPTTTTTVAAAKAVSTAPAFTG